jgi:hypothetical protein
MRIADIIIRIFTGSFLLIAIPGLIHMIREDIRMMQDLREKGLL